MKKWMYAMAMASVIGIAGVSVAAVPAFEKLDQNADGKLSKSEASKVEGLDFAKADSNGDGMLDKSEYEAAVS